MESLGKESKHPEKRRQRLHELLIALIQRENDLELMDSDSPDLKRVETSSSGNDPAKWLDRNRRILSKYQALVRTAITLDALLDSE
tara:strand:+ start:224 stop:481 length:258 start_codon:yes stop_codon:yes gene_type:complete